jgi:hypothetical protein
MALTGDLHSACPATVGLDPHHAVGRRARKREVEDGERLARAPPPAHCDDLLIVVKSVRSTVGLTPPFWSWPSDVILEVAKRLHVVLDRSLLGWLREAERRPLRSPSASWHRLRRARREGRGAHRETGRSLRARGGCCSAALRAPRRAPRARGRRRRDRTSAIATTSSGRPARQASRRESSGVRARELVRPRNRAGNKFLATEGLTQRNQRLA